MKKSLILILSSLLFCAMTFSTLQATNPISLEAYNTISAESAIGVTTISMAGKQGALFKIKKELKRIKSKIKTTYYKVAGMFSDPVRKWMWFWLIFGLLGVLLFVGSVAIGFGNGATTLFRIVYYLGIASSTFSGVSFVIWIIKLIQG